MKRSGMRNGRTRVALRFTRATLAAATAAADPLEEPPGVRFGSKGLVVGPDLPIANSVVTVLPMTIAPPRLSAATHAASYFGRQPL